MTKPFGPDQDKINSIRKRIIDSPIKLSDEIVKTMSLPKDFCMEGWVYVLSNETMPGIYKVGMTTSSPEARAKELSQGTGVAMPFKVELAFFSDNPRRDEAEIHEYLDLHRLNPNREFFRCSLEDIQQAMHDSALLERSSTVEQVADRADVIVFNKTDSLNLADLFDEIGISTFGDKLAIAEVLIRMACRTVKSELINGNSILINSGKVTRIQQQTTQMYEEYLRDNKREEPKKVFHSPF